MNLVLASTSPRRLELLARLGVTPSRIAAPDVDETPLKAEAPRAYVERVARAKAEAVPRGAGEVILAADTSIAAGRRILGKPADAADLARMLGLLAGRRHHCYSAVCVIDATGKARTRLSDTIVAFKPLSPAEIAAYIASGEGMGKAGGYAIQGRAEAFVRFLSGSHSGVVGLPLFETRTLLLAAGLLLAEWLYERGIGEHRAALIEDGHIVEARIEPDDAALRVGTILSARLTDIRARIATLADGTEILLERLPPGITQGAALTLEITREALPEPGRSKPARATPTDAAPAPAPTFRDRLTNAPVRDCLAHEPDALEAAGWSELLDEARTGDMIFPGGALRMSPTPAMTLFDVDGDPPLDALAIRAATAVAQAVRRHGIGGSIGIDFPTLPGKAPRNAVAAAMDAALAQPFERTAMNGFGFLQIVRPRPRASLPEILRADPLASAARAALRTLEREPPTAPNRHRLSAAVTAKIESHPEWLVELVRRTGRIPIFDR